ncbi:hypothetical protein G3I40_42765 [Streptomyces sp. SID14478]|uniref:hypothetical protein n=1 Tax=Streptomyces sp. SID14478 TaxID=2706073 RepID=UPI0013E07746|nr:hypothetical protein [Streptomyces sp. SID14478]NEB81891.1 hypothetical protein [Streptomyces sp. SID14478]
MSSPVMARGDGLDSPAEWAGFVGILVLYLVIGYGLELRSKRRRGARQPAKAAAKGLFVERGNDPGQSLASRMIMLAGGLAAGITGFLTRGAPTAVQVVAVGVVAVVGIFVWAYFDHRTEPREEA